MPTDAALRLYDGACEALATAQGLSAAARRPDVGPAIPATLGCLAETLAELGASSSALAEELRRTRTLSDRPASACTQALDGLTGALDAAAGACEIARAKAALAAAASTKGAT